MFFLIKDVKFIKIIIRKEFLNDINSFIYYLIDIWLGYKYMLRIVLSV